MVGGLKAWTRVTSAETVSDMSTADPPLDPGSL